MVNRSKRRTGALMAISLVAGCDSTSPGSGRLLRVEGQVLEANQPPAPPLQVDVQAWPSAPGGNDSTTLQTDAAGGYAAELGPFTDPPADSLRVRVTQNDCDLLSETVLWRRDLALDEGDALTLPTLALSYRLPLAQIGIGQEMCAAIVTRSTPETIGDVSLLALWFDDISDSVRGRWRLNHQASIGDDYGYFSGSQELDRVVLQLRPTQPTPCTGLQLDMPFGGDNGSTFGVSDLTGSESCFVPSTAVRFFQGASLPEVLPP
ncbi:MAG: hypothetical protein M3454_07730 [Actinomycetota bacterium]|nr:hypothetical protein [Actinomycetota bacterium]